MKQLISQKRIDLEFIADTFYRAKATAMKKKCVVVFCFSDDVFCFVDSETDIKIAVEQFKKIQFSKKRHKILFCKSIENAAFFSE